MSTLAATSVPRIAPAPVSSERPLRVEAFGLSDQGIRRSTNEDAYAVILDAGLFLVADGMGGHAAGDVASRMAIDAVRAVFEEPDLTWPAGVPLPTQATGVPVLRASIEQASALVHAASVADSTKKGMGTTLTALLVLEDRVAIGHVGDSRAYVLRGRQLGRLTCDHTMVNELMAAGVLTSDEAATSEIRHMLSRFVGSASAVEVDTCLVAVEPGDTFLLTSDGLHGVLDDETIAAVLVHEHDLTCAATELVRRANERGGPDNITVVLVRIR